MLLIEGPTLVAEAIADGVSLEAIYLDNTDELDTSTTELVSAAERQGITIHRVASGVLVGITDSVTPRPVLAVAPIPSHTADSVVIDAARRRCHVLVLVDVRDPGNVGTIVRAADASGAAGVLCATGTADPWSPKVVRSSAGAVLHLPVATGLDAASLLDTLATHRVPTIATVVDGGVPFDCAPLAGAVALVLGNEASGLSTELAAGIEQAVTIPMQGWAESLNVAMAASVLSFEALRQRRAVGAGPDSDWTRPDTDDKVITP